MQWAKAQKGFTIVELLIVIVVIAILAAITIVAYNGIQERARNASAQSAASQAARKIAVYAALNSDQYPPSLAAADIQNPNNILQYTGGGAGYCVTATTQNVSYFQSNTSQVAKGACPGHGLNGSPVITNMMPNGSFETGTGGWGTSSASIQRSTSNAASGAYSIEVTGTSTSGSGDLRITGATQTAMSLGLEPGKTYTLSARVTYPDAVAGDFNRSPRILVWYSTDGSQWIETFGPKAPAAAGTYTVSHTFTLPSNTTGILLGAGVASTMVNQKFYYDAFMLTEGSTQYSYADGSTPGWVWNGTPFSTTSRGSAPQ
jgi:prepilin-type N-terminal cleavage/methylation domain-containing protein